MKPRLARLFRRAANRLDSPRPDTIESAQIRLIRAEDNLKDAQAALVDASGIARWVTRGNWDIA